MDRTNAERQRRYITKLKAAATREQARDNTSLRQENGALRRQIATTKQELAQQRAMANAARPQGLAMKALKATMTQPNGGVVGFHDADLEFHEAECLPPYQLSIPPWVPPEARAALKEMWEHTLPDKGARMALKRLATDGKMRRSVWDKLRNVTGVAEIIPLAIEARGMFAWLRPPPQSKRREALQRYQQHLDKLRINHPHPTGGLLTCATSATDLRYVLESLRKVLAPTGDREWSRYWRGDPAMNSMGAAISFLAALADCLIAIDDEQRSDVKRLPQITSRWDKRAEQRFFARIMSDKMQELCGRPRRDVVAALVRVAFNVDDVTTDTVREWCR